MFVQRTRLLTLQIESMMPVLEKSDWQLRLAHKKVTPLQSALLGNHQASESLHKTLEGKQRLSIKSC